MKPAPVNFTRFHFSLGAIVVRKFNSNLVLALLNLFSRTIHQPDVNGPHYARRVELEKFVPHHFIPGFRNREWHPANATLYAIAVIYSLALSRIFDGVIVNPLGVIGITTGRIHIQFVAGILLQHLLNARG
ncbi:hypothetical protein D3C75_807070 [compost metagenome]